MEDIRILFSIFCAICIVIMSYVAIVIMRKMRERKKRAADERWIRKMADAEDRCESVSAGSMVKLQEIHQTLECTISQLQVTEIARLKALCQKMARKLESIGPKGELVSDINAVIHQLIEGSK